MNTELSCMLRSDVISLRKVEPKDLPFLYQWENDCETWEYSNTHNPLSQKDLRDYIESSSGDIYKDSQLRLVIESAMPDSLHCTLGCIDLFDFDPHNKKAAVGIYLSKDWRRKGLGKETVCLIEQYAFSYLKLHMLYAFVAEQNTASMRLFSACKWQQTATLPKWLNSGNVIVFQKIF